METAEQIIDNAVKGFEENLDDRKAQQFSGTNVLQIKRRIVAIQSAHEAFKKIIGLNRLKSFLQAWEQFDATIKSLDAGSPRLSGFIWGPLEWILRVAGEDAKTLDCILCSYAELGERLVPISELGNGFTDNELSRKCLAWMFSDLLLFHKQMLKLFEPKEWHGTFEAQWKDYNDKSLFKVLLDAFQRNSECINRALKDQTLYSIHRRINDHVLRHGNDMNNVLRHISEYEKDRQKLFAEAQKAEDERKARQYLDVCSWLRSPLESEKARHSHCQAVHSKHPDTGTWIFDEEKITYWMDIETPPYSMLWLQGSKGAGKTILASVIIQKLADSRADAITSYFYCRSGDETSGESVYLKILKSLLRQILEIDRDRLAALYHSRVNGRHSVEILDDESTAKHLLEILCDGIQRHFIVIDGLDEMDRTERKAVVDCLFNIVKKSDRSHPGRIRVLFVSTDLDDMRTRAKSVDALDVYDLSPEKTEKDINLYLEERAISWNAKFRLPKQDIDRAIKAISAGSNGMFLYAFLVSDNLFNQPTQARFLHEMSSPRFPKDLETAYAPQIFITFETN
jgi:hypothetical protein